MHAVKFADRSKGLVEGLGVPYGEDLYGETFVETTNFALGWFKQRPLLFEHGRDDLVGIDELGSVRKIDPVEKGLWVQTQLNKRHDYYEAIAELIDAEALGFSSGSAPNLIKVDSTGVIRNWPILEMSLTTSPANPLAKIKSFKSFVAICSDNGVDIEALKSTYTPPPQRDDADYIWIQKVRMQHGI